MYWFYNDFFFTSASIYIFWGRSRKREKDALRKIFENGKVTKKILIILFYFYFHTVPNLLKIIFQI